MNQNTHPCMFRKGFLKKPRHLNFNTVSTKYPHYMINKKKERELIYVIYFMNKSRIFPYLMCLL